MYSGLRGWRVGPAGAKTVSLSKNLFTSSPIPLGPSPTPARHRYKRVRHRESPFDNIKIESPEEIYEPISWFGISLYCGGFREGKAQCGISTHNIDKIIYLFLYI